MTPANVLTLFLLVWFLLWFLRRELDAHRAYVAAERDAAEYVGIDDLLDGRPQDSDPAPEQTDQSPRRPAMPAEAAYQFPGVPEGWSLDRYTRDGLQQLTLHLVQSARRRP